MLPQGQGVLPGAFRQLPRLGKLPPQQLQKFPGGLVCPPLPVQGPDSEDGEFPQGRRPPGVIRCRRDIVRRCPVGLHLVAVEGKIQLPQGRGGQQGFPLPGQKNAVGGKIHLEIPLPGQIQELRQQRVEERLPFHMKVEILGVGAQLLQRPQVFLPPHKSGGPPPRGAEGAAKVADVGDFQINFFKTKRFHKARPS